jgi:lipopolysaccharide assembly outer membrane protein LptD (OstA)
VDNISLTPNHLNLIKNEFDAYAKYKNFVFGLGHVFMQKKYINKCYNDYNQEIHAKLQYNFYQNWWIETKAKRKLGPLLKEGENEKCEKTLTEKPRKIGKWISNEIGFAYKGDCLKINFGVERDYYRPKGLKPSITTYLRIEPVFN